MAPVFLSLCWLLLLDHQLGSGAPTPGPVFLSGQAADSVLRRQKRHNSGVFEEFMEGNLERECLEEMCDLEEAREVFENDDKTMEFWARYVDGDQCISNPCQNQGTCKDHHGSYTCTCVPGSTGRNCEIVTSRRCDLNNGGCTHFCEPLATFGATCSCADGYRLAPDGMDCEPSSEFACGRDILTPVISGLSTRSLLANEITIAENETSPRDNSTAASPVTSPAGTTAPPLRQNDLLAASLQTRLWARGDIDGLTKHNIKDLKRIVGGQDVIPGEIPWQVALIARPSGHFFCGGSILSPLWVITAAHCLVEGQGSFFIRVGDYNINTREDTEQNLEVLTEYVHPRYDAALSLYNHDIALLRLQNPINFSSTARPICLGPKAFIEALVKEASPATVSGWGRTRFQGATASTLQKVEVTFTERTECKDSSSARITRYMFCAGYSDVAKDSCQGDSGGPHTNRFHGTWFLTGIVSWGEECAKEGKYGVYTRLSHYNRWIRHVLGTTHHKAEEPNVDEPDA